MSDKNPFKCGGCGKSPRQESFGLCLKMQFLFRKKAGEAKRETAQSRGEALKGFYEIRENE